MFSDLLNEITVEVLLKRYKHNGEIEFKPVYSNSVAKTVTNQIFRIEIVLQEILYMIDVWINSESGWIIESIKSQYINIWTYRPLSRSSYMNLLVELRRSKKE